ncbi:MAG: potassium channel protein [Dehalococcoidia bacterium]|nr:potassium channel protein [Dehalococcoidia bacterium]
MGSKRNYVTWIIVLFILFSSGTVGYMLIEHWTLFESLYMTVLTIATLGGEVHPLSTAGRAFTIVLTLLGVGTVLYILTGIVQATLEIELGSFRRSRMEARIKKLENHFVLCGYGRVGEAIAGTLKQQKTDFIVIDQSVNSFNNATRDGCLAIMDDATKHEVLKHANVEKARGLITAFGDDAYNTYAVLTAREINPMLTIIGRANNNDAVRRLKQAGATHVILPEAIGGQQMARLALRPSTVQFIETVLADNQGEYLVEEVYINENSTLIGKTIKDIEEKFAGVRIMAIRDRDGDAIINPTLDTTVEIGRSLTAFGAMQQLQEIESCCSLIRDSKGQIVPDL